MKIAYLFGSLNRGGTETLMLDVCRHIAKNNPMQAIGVYRKGGLLEREFLSTNLPFFHIPTKKNPLLYILALRKRLIREQINVAHAQQPIDALYAYFACLGTKIKVVLTLHGFDYNVSKYLHRFILKRTYKNIYVSKYVKDYYTQKYDLNSALQAIIYNGVNFQKLDTDKETAILPQRKIESPVTAVKLAMVGNFVPVREQNTVCKFLKLLKEKGVYFDFYFVGAKSESTPHLYDDCVKYCKENNLDEVHFLGSRKDVPAILKQLDAFVYSTDHDTFGIAVVEAIAAAVPVFVNDWAVMQEITENGTLATLYKTKDEKDLLEKFILFLQNKEVYCQKAKRNAILVREKYSIEKHVENLNKNYLQNEIKVKR